MVEDLTRACNRLGKFLLRHGHVWSGASNWTLEHRRWLAGRHFDDKALKLSSSRYMAVMEEREADLEATTADLVPYYAMAPFANAVARLVPVICTEGPHALGSGRG